MLIPDHETDYDLLNGEAISRSVVEVIKTNQGQALTAGIHGDWGAGKSSVLKMIEKELSGADEFAVLWFNGWTFEGFDDAKTVLIESIISELCRQKSTIGKVKEKATSLLKRVNWLKIARKGGMLAFNVLTGLPSPDQVETAISALTKMAHGVLDIKPEDMPEKLNQIKGYLKPAEEADNLPETIHAFRQEFKELLKAAKIQQLVVLIDDLDRCLPETAIHTLEAIRLFLFVPNTAFIIGADESMIEYAVRKHFPDLPITSSGLGYSRNYLEKLIQIPFRIPALGIQETRTYVTLLLVRSLVDESHPGFNKLLEKAKESIKQPWLSSGLTQADIQDVDTSKKQELDSIFLLSQQIAPILAEGTKGNPRQIKRFLNTLFLRQVIAKARGYSDLINQAILAKLMLAERFQPDFYEHISAQSMVSRDGQATDISLLETYNDTNQSNKKEQTATVENSPVIEKWLEREWLMRWLNIKPTLGKIDLRPYVFVARDRRIQTGVSSLGILEELVQKLCGSELQLRGAEPEVRTLDASDADTVFRELRERVVSAGSLRTEPTGMKGLALVAKHHSRFQGELVNLLGSFDVKDLGFWVVRGWNESIVEPAAQAKLRQIIGKWAQQDDNTSLKKAAESVQPALAKRG